MKWLVEEFLNGNENVQRIIQVLEKDAIDYLIVKVNTDESLSVIDKELHVPMEESDEILASFIKDSSIMVYGGKKIIRATETMGLSPGSFLNHRFDFSYLQKYIDAKNILLNDEFIVGDLWSLTPIADRFFIRPTGNTKLMDGQVMTKEEFLAFQSSEGYRNGNSRFREEMLMMAPYRQIHAECRFFVVDGQVVAGSMYRKDGHPQLVARVPRPIECFARLMAVAYRLADAYVMDIADTEDGLRIIEYNNINTSGLYAADEQAIVKALQDMCSKKQAV